MRIKLFLLSGFLAFNIFTFGQISRQQAIDTVVNFLVAEDTGKIYVYAADSLMTKYDSLSLYSGEKLKSYFVNNWVFFIDDNPNAGWSHTFSLMKRMGQIP
jgi:hypothetical protein